LRFVAFSAWLLNWPERGSLPVNSQRLVMVVSSFARLNPALSGKPLKQPERPGVI
jgi:hypothetical protein